jgi:3-hydroxyisobutyrate dehydrogenase
MGKPMAANLLRAGYSLSVFNRRQDKSEVLTTLGAAMAESPQGVATISDVVITMLPDTRAVAQVLFGEQGIAQGLNPGSIVIDMSTISPGATVEFASRLAAIECEMLDAPVSGGEKGAAAGTLGIMVGGPRNAFEKCQPIFHALGKIITYTGPSGHGQKTKLINQLVGATNLLGAVEGLRLARAAGLDPETTLQAISSGAASSWMLANLGPMILQEDFAPGFSIRLQQKDMKLLKEWISELGGDFPAANLVYSLFTKALEMGLEDQGNQGLINIWER